MYFNQIEFGHRVQESRKFAGMTQEELADRLGIDKNHVSRIECILRRPAAAGAELNGRGAAATAGR